MRKCGKWSKVRGCVTRVDRREVVVFREVPRVDPSKEVSWRRILEVKAWML